MSNGQQDVIQDLDFEERIKKMSERDLLEFTARQTYELNTLCDRHNSRLKKLEDNSKRNTATSTGVSAGMGSIVAILWTWLSTGDWPFKG